MVAKYIACESVLQGYMNLHMSLNGSEPSHFFVHLMHSVVRLEQSTISAAIAGPWHSGSISDISACSRYHLVNLRKDE